MSAKKLSEVRIQFVRNVSAIVLKQLSDDLHEDGILNGVEIESINEECLVRAEKARCLIDMVRRKSEKACQKMINRIEERDSNLYKQLLLCPGASPKDVDVAHTAALIPHEAMTPEKDVDLNYRMTQSPLGLCVIISNTHSHGSQSEKVPDADTDALQEVFGWLDFTVVCHKDLTAEEMQRVMWDCSQEANGDCFVCCVLNYYENEDVIECDNAILPIKDIAAPFTDSNCPGLRGKPKLFFIQACRKVTRFSGADISQEHTSGVDVPSVSPWNADFLVTVASVDWFDTKGSWFVQSLCRQLKEGTAVQKDISAILVKINHDPYQEFTRTTGMAATGKLCQIISMLTKTLIFPLPRQQQAQDDSLPSTSAGSAEKREESMKQLVDRSTAANTDNLGISGGESHCETHRPTRYCKSCSLIKDTSHWVLMEPSVSMETGVPLYKHKSSAGSFECAVSGLRWVCAGEITLQYQICDPGVFTAELAMLQYTPISSLMDITVLSGELLEAHLPHFACLEGSDSSLSEAVRVLRGDNNGICLESCQLTRFHAKIYNPSFSLVEVLVKIGIPVKTHLEVLIYRTLVKPLILLTYMIPWNASMIQTVKDDLKKQRAKKIEKPQPDTSLWVNSKFSLRASCNSEITPKEYTLNYVRPNFFEVYMKEPQDCFDLELVSGEQSIWTATMRRVDYDEAETVVPMEVSYTSTAASLSQDEGTMASMSNRERLSIFRPDLIKRTSGGVLRDLLEGLQGLQPPVITSREAQEVLQGTSVLQDQLTCLLDMVCKKGEKACGILLVLLKELDFYLYEDILQKLQENLPGDAK